MNSVRFQFISTVLSSQREQQIKIDYIYGALDAILKSTEPEQNLDTLSNRIICLSQLPRLTPEKKLVQAIFTFGASYAYATLYDQKRAEEILNKRDRIIDQYLTQILKSNDPAHQANLVLLTKIVPYLGNKHLGDVLDYALEKDITPLIAQCRAIYTPPLEKWQSAVVSHDYNHIQRCIENGVDVDIPFKNGETALGWLSKQHPNDLHLLLVLARAGANPSLAQCENILIWATKNNHPEIALAFIPQSNRAYLDAQDNKGDTALTWAVEKNQFEVVVALTEAGANRDLIHTETEFTALTWAIQKKYDKIALFLIKANQNYPHIPKSNLNIPTKKKNTALTFAATNGQASVISALLEQPEVDLDAQNCDNRTALACAILNGHEEIALPLIEKMKQQPRLFYLETNQGGTAFTLALSQKKKRVVAALLDCGVDPNRKNSQGYNAFTWAIHNNQLDVVRDLLLNGEVREAFEQRHIVIDMNAQTPSGDTPLMLAVASSNENFSRVFFAAEGFDRRMPMNYNIRNSQGETALHIAIRLHKTDVALRLIKGMNLSGERELAKQLLKFAAVHNEDLVIDAIGQEMYLSSPPLPPFYSPLVEEDASLPPYVGDVDNSNIYEHKEE